MQPTKQPPAAIEVRFERDGLYPEEIPIYALSRTLSAVQRLVAAHDVEEEEEDDTTGALGDSSLRLLRVKRGSALYQVGGPDRSRAAERLRLVGRILDRPEEIGENDYVLDPIRR